MGSNIIRFDDIDEHGPQEYRGTYDIPTAELDRTEVASLGPVAIETRVEKGNDAGEYVAAGSAKFSIDYNCARCLEPYPFANSSNFHVRFRPRQEASAENEEIEISDDELDVEFYTGREIPLRDLAVEQVQLSIPMKPLCGDDCLGLCPQCGVNRNRESCRCETSVVDERWGSLQEIREQLARKKDI